jgi:UDP-N-acetylmuramyl pentapeptide phosphotransferase/UDP-N-acetylglucosamine-1-phosphate transferase
VAESSLPAAPAILLALVLATCAVAALSRWAKILPQAPPTARSLHERPVLRVGGLAIWAGFIPVALLSPPSPAISTLAWFAPWLAVALVSLQDDWRGVHPVPRLAVHAVAALVAAAGLGGSLADATTSLWSLLYLAFVALVIAWSANLFNFMDGNDGLAATMALFGFGAYAMAAWIAGVPPQIYAALAAATVPFLAVNLPPARAFMGDVGAVPLGFLAAVFGIAGWRQGIWPGWFPLLVFAPFVVDATATLCRRIARGERIWEAHRMHYYQRLHQLGARHRGTLGAYCGLMVGAAATALSTLALRPGAGWWALAAWTAILAALFACIDYHWTQKNTNTS